MRKDGIPLPSALSGNIIERLIRVDEALLYLILGALAELTDDWNFEQTGTLTADDTKSALMDMLWCFQGDCSVTEIGSIVMWPTFTVPAKWIKCNGQDISRSFYPDLFSLIGTSYGAGNGSTTFNVPNLNDRSPMGAGGAIVPTIGATAGASTVTLSAAQMPTHDHTVVDPGHNHGITDPGHVHVIEKSNGVAGGAVSRVGASATGHVTPDPSTLSAVTGISVNSHGANISLATSGLSQSHANIHPVIGLNFMIYAGK